MSDWLRKGWVVVIATAMLAGCGGTGSSTDSTDPTVPVAAQLVLLSEKVQLGSSGVEASNLIAVVKDASNVVLTGQTVVFQSTSGDVTTTQPTTDANGQALASIQVGNDKSNRTITVTATVAGTTVSDTIDINVVDSVVSIQGPSALVLDADGSYSISLTDSDGNPISGEDVTLSSELGNALSDTTVTTDASGNATFALTASNGGDETLSASALDGSVTAELEVSISTDEFVLRKCSNPATTPCTASVTDIPLNTDVTLELEWIQDGTAQAGQDVVLSTTRGSFNGGADSSVEVTTDADGRARATLAASNAGGAVITGTAASGPSTTLALEFIATIPSRVDLTAAPTSIGPSGQQSTITAQVRDAAGNAVKNRTVNFSLNDVSGGTLSRGSAVTDSSGKASTVYQSNDVTGQNGAVITGTVSGTAISDDVTVTVAGRNLFITLGTGNEIESDVTSYTMEFLVFVNDANGQPVADQQLTISAIPTPSDVLRDPQAGIPYTGYMKGYYVAGTCGTSDCWVPGYTAVTDFGGTNYIGCLSEDDDRDGVLDPGEDDNNDGRLTPGNVVAAPGVVTTDDEGFAVVRVRYAKQYGNWTRIELKATASVAGTESSASQVLILPVAAEDVEIGVSPPGVPNDVPGTDITLYASPFGLATDCANPS